MLTTDHIALVVRDLESATERYAALLGCEPIRPGVDDFTVDEGDKDAWFQKDTWFQLDNLALRIIAPGTGDADDPAQAQLEQHGEGIWAIAFATPDIVKTRHVLERRGIPSSEAQPSWTTSTLARESTFGTTIVLVERESDALRRPRSASNLAPQSCVSALDHVVITTAQPERAAALYGARLGLEMKLDRSNPDWGSRLLFFKSGDLIVEVAHSLKNIDPITPDKIWGLSWRVTDIASAYERMRQSDLDLSEIRTGRKPGTQVFTVRNAAANVPTLVIGRA